MRKNKKKHEKLRCRTRFASHNRITMSMIVWIWQRLNLYAILEKETKRMGRFTLKSWKTLFCWKTQSSKWSKSQKSKWTKSKTFTRSSSRFHWMNLKKNVRGTLCSTLRKISLTKSAKRVDKPWHNSTWSKVNNHHLSSENVSPYRTTTNCNDNFTIDRLLFYCVTTFTIFNSNILFISMNLSWKKLFQIWN